ncbi:MAG: beta-N-acetylhexosaminidase [Bryobacteraceae bacterium]
MPRTVTPGAGALKIDKSFRLAFSTKPNARLERAGQRMVAVLSRQTGIPFASSPAPATLLIACAETTDQPDRLGEDESYSLDVTSAQARLTAATTAGALRGMQTFLQLITADQGAFSAPAVHIEDAPRFPWRGLLIDVTSHFMPVPVILRNLDAMEAVKLNVFHWHLTDDQGFRVESKVFPLLHQVGSDGNYYTQQEIREVLAYAHDRGIRIVPELDMPGHCASWLVGYPHLGSAPGPYSIIHTFGIYDPTLDPTRDEVYQFIDKLVGEMAGLFPDEYFHVGGDEVTGKHWKNNPSIQAFVRQHSLQDEAGLQAHFNRRVEAIVRKHGKKMVGWDEVLHRDLPRDIMVQSWRDQESLAAAAGRGYPAILSFGYYLDHLKPAKNHYSVDPLGGQAKKLSSAEAARILGGEACMWTEFVNPETIDSRIWPRTAAIAERLWSRADVTDVDSMHQRLEAISRRLDWRGVVHNTNYGTMLHRLSSHPDALKTLADVVEPLGIDGREPTQVYSQFTPLNRLVDAARAESVTVRRLEQEITRFLAALGQSADREKQIRETLVLWRDSDRRLAPDLSSFLLREAAPLSQDLSRLGVIGLEALDYARSGQAAPAGWANQNLALLDQMEKPRAEVVLAAVRPVRILVRAAGKR